MADIIPGAAWFDCSGYYSQYHCCGFICKMGNWLTKSPRYVEPEKITDYC